LWGGDGWWFGIIRALPATESTNGTGGGLRLGGGGAFTLGEGLVNLFQSNEPKEKATTNAQEGGRSLGGGGRRGKRIYHVGEKVEQFQGKRKNWVLGGKEPPKLKKPNSLQRAAPLRTPRSPQKEFLGPLSEKINVPGRGDPFQGGSK